MIKRLGWSVYRDFRVQLRNGYPWITALAALACIFVFARIPMGNSDRLAPFVSVAFSLLTTVPFLIRQLDGERKEGTLALLDLTPVRPHEYLASKAISLAIPSIAMNTMMVLVSRGPYFNPIPFWTGLVLSGLLSAFLAFLILAWAGNAPKALALSGLAAAVLLLPLLPGMGSLPRALVFVQPMGGPAGLLAGSYIGISPWVWMAGAAMGSLWVLIALVACRKGFARFRSGA